MKNVLILGIGNTILSDDGVGICAARVLKEQLADTDVEVQEAHQAGLELLDLISGYKKVIIVDSIQTRQGRPGEIHRVTYNTLKGLRFPYASHQLGLPLIIKLAQKLEIALPEKIIIFAIEIENGNDFGESLAAKVKKAIPQVITLIKEELAGEKIKCMN